MTHYSDELRVQFLLDGLTRFRARRGWKVLSNRAAAWLREIVTDGGDA